MALDTPINRQALIKVFPDLKNDLNFTILSDVTYVYNCIAWAMGYTDRWVDPYVVPGHWWPAGVARNLLPETLIEAFKSEGFELTDNYYPEEGYYKAVLYKKKDADQWTHAARVVTSEIEYSKFGEAWDGQHSHDVLCNTGMGQEALSYGVAYAYMRRKTALCIPTKLKGKIDVDPSNIAKIKALLVNKNK